jgi:membrane protein DedA with SNARE-associated domain
MELSEYLVMFGFVVLLGAGVPGPGDAALLAAGTLAGEGRLNVWIVAGLALAAWMVGAMLGYWVGFRGGRALLDHPGRFAKSRQKMLAKGDSAFARYTFMATVTLPKYVVGIFRVRYGVFLLGAVVAGGVRIVLYVGLSYFFGAEIAERVGNTGTKALLGVVVVVAAGLAIRALIARWSAVRSERRAAALPAGDE